MRWEIRWRHAAAAQLRHIHWREAARVDATVQRFAASGEGELERVGDSRSDYRLLISGFSILIEVHTEDAVIEVWCVSRSRG